MKSITKIIFLLITLSLTNNVIAQKSQGLYNRIDSIIKKEHAEKKFNGNILVVQKGETIYENSYGYADASQKLKLNKNFKFQIGSVYKEFPAVAIMQLYEKGLISLEDNIDKYIPELPNWSKDVSIKNLLQYSGGLPDIQMKKYPPEKLVTTDEVFNDIVNTKELAYKPGTSYIYTNYSPLLLMKVAENVSHQSFTNYAKEHLFNSDDIVIAEEYPYKNNVEMAISFNGKYVADPFKFAIPFLFASNARGLYNWFKRIEQNELISQQSKLFLGKTANILTDKSMQSPFGKVRICEEPISGSTSIVEHTHDGSLGNFKCIARRFNQEDLTIIILTNQNNNNVYPISESIYKVVTEK